jgi:adhesin transport system outer membrane protein
MLEHRLGTFGRRWLTTCLLTAAATGAAAAAAPAAHAGLGDALQASLRNHPAVAGQQAELAARRYAADGVRSQRYPTLSIQAQRYTAEDRSVLSGEDLSNPAVLRVRQPLWAFGRIHDDIAVADAEVGIEHADLSRVRRQLMEDTAVAYARVHGSHELVHLARRNVAEHRELLAQIQRRAQGQLASDADARLAATRLAQAQALLQRAVSDWEIAQDDLVALTGVAQSAEAPVPPDLLELDQSPELVERFVDDSAEIRVRRERLDLAEAEVDRARTSAMPTVYLQADQFYDQPGLRDDSQISVVFEASLEGLGFAARGRRGEAVASRMAARQDLAAARLELTRELERLQRSRRLQSELIELQTLSLADLETLLDSYQRQYESGTKSWLDLMNIQRELFEQRRQLMQAQIDWQIHSLQLLARTGGLDGLAGIDEGTDD